MASARPSGCGATRSAVAAVAAAGRRSKWVVLAMAICHEAIAIPPAPAATTGDAAAAAAAAAFQTPSADEAALIHAAAELGISFIKRTASTIEYAKGGAVHSVELLAMSPFTHERKRMSVLVRHASGRHVLYCKGADEVMLSRLASGGSTMYGGGGGGGGGHHDVHELAVMQISTFASQGLRTLVFAMAGSTSARPSVGDRYSAAIASTNSSATSGTRSPTSRRRSRPGSPFSASRASRTRSPPACRARWAAREAGVKMVVTGDNHETAVTVARAAGLLQDNNSIVSLHGTSLRATRARRRTIRRGDAVARAPRAARAAGGGDGSAAAAGRARSSR